MEKFKNLKSIPAHMPILNIDTDMIIPKQFLKTIKRTGLGKNLFYEMRYDENDKLIKDFILNKKPFTDSKILLAGKNFGCGSSREHAAMEPRFRGCKVVIVKSFARIHEANLKKQGILPLTFDNKDDYALIEQDDKLTIQDPSNIEPNKQVIVNIEKSDGKILSIITNHSLSDEQIIWFRAGSALNYIKSS